MEQYILAYKQGFVRLYEDSGLGDAEAVIIENCIRNGEFLLETFHAQILSHLTREIVGHSVNADGSFVTTVSIGSRRLFITYIENTTTMTRNILDMEIYRR